MKLTAGLLLLALCLTAEGYRQRLDYIHQVPSVSSSTPKKCVEPGLLCETCSNLVACIENSDGTYFKEQVETCSSSQRCVGGACVQNTTDPFCSGLADFKFICRKVGIFPDPFYCNHFVLCVNSSSSSTLVPYVNECEEGFQFNVVTSLCDVELEHGQCEEGIYPVPICEEVGQSGALRGKPEMFYICEDYNDKLYPVLNVCPGGQIYDDYRCSTVAPTTTTAGPTMTFSTLAPN